jgi:hypothetical protein
LPACAHCTNEFPEAPRRGPRPKTYCSPKCQIKAANIRRDLKRKGDLSTAGEPSGRTPASDPMRIPPTPSTPLSDAPNARLSELMEKAHSRTGINAFELADLARLKGLSPWTPFRLIVAKDYQPRRKL